MASAHQPVEYGYSADLQIYVPPILMVIGTIGNALSLIIWTKSCFRTPVSSYIYLAVLSGVDTIVLFLGLFKDWITLCTGYNASSLSHWGCKLFTVFGYLATDFSVWIIIAVTAERYIAVCHPLQSYSMCTVDRAIKVILLLFTVLLALNFHLFFTAGLRHVEYNVTDACFNVSLSETRCGAILGYERLVHEVWPYLDLCIYSFLPFLILIVLNCLIIHKVSTAAVRRRRYTQPMLSSKQGQGHHGHRSNSAVNAGTHSCRFPLGGGSAVSSSSSPSASTSQAHSHHSSTSSPEAKLTVMLLAISFTFLLTTLPTNIVVILNSYWNARLPYMDCASRVSTHARMELATVVTRLLMYSNHSVNFYLYCATGQKFRHQLQTLFTCRRDRGGGAIWRASDRTRAHGGPSTKINGRSFTENTETLPLSTRLANT